MSRLFAVILKCFKLLDMSYLPMQKCEKIFPKTWSVVTSPMMSLR